MFTVSLANSVFTAGNYQVNLKKFESGMQILMFQVSSKSL